MDPLSTLSNTATSSGLSELPSTMEMVAQGSRGLEQLAPPLQIALLLGSLALLTAVLVSVTSFTRIVIVLSFVRRALTTQEIPPNPTLIGLALFMTWFTMGPVFDAIQRDAVAPYFQESITGVEAFTRASGHIRTFMLRHTRTSDLQLFLELANGSPVETPEDTPLRVLIPAFLISELKTAFIMGFCLYIPFMLIDLLVSTILMSLGMMMMPPVVVSAPIKLLLFVLVDGWHLIAEALGTSLM
jgi:flagellar biosynthetic protein FliP